MSTIIRADGTVEESTPGNGRDYQLAELQAIVGGYIEVLRAPDGRWMFLNEDGKRLELPLNRLATTLMAGRIAAIDYIVGDVVLCTGLEAGEEIDSDVEPIEDDRPVCPTCGSKGFAPSRLPNRCEFCDGTEGGNPPTDGEVAAAARGAAEDDSDDAEVRREEQP